MDAEGWLWHLLNDPVRSNPWSLALMILISASTVAGMVVPTAVAVLDGRRARRQREAEMKIFRRREDETVGDPRHETEHETETDGEDTMSRWVDAGQDGSAGPLAQYPTAGTKTRTTSGPASVQFIQEVHATPDGAGVLVLRPEEPDPSATQPVSDSGVHAMPEMQRDPAVLFGHKVECKGCEGRGYVIVSTRDLLRESIGLVGDGGDAVVKEFYQRLLGTAPALAVLFPTDLLTEDSIKRQREKLLNALTALAHLYDPDDQTSMDKLTTALKAFGRSHASFDRQDGSRRGATFDEYAAVKGALLDTLTDAAGKAWRPEYSDAWSEAYDFAAVTMLAEQYATIPAIARQPRASADQPLRGMDR